MTLTLYISVACLHNNVIRESGQSSSLPLSAVMGIKINAFAPHRLRLSSITSRMIFDSWRALKIGFAVAGPRGHHVKAPLDQRVTMATAKSL